MFNIANSEYGKNVFNKELLKLTRTPIADVEKALLENIENVIPRKDEIRQEINDLISNKDAIQYFKENIWDRFSLNEKETTNAFSAKELKLIYYKIVGIEIVSKKTTKTEIIAKIIDFINSEVRANDLAKDLY